jgi:hypothetical protein
MQYAVAIQKTTIRMQTLKEPKITEKLPSLLE